MWWIKTPERRLTIPDWLSIYRLVAAPFLVVLILLEERMFFGVFLTVSFLTDALDGFIARKLKITSERGSQLDSIGDAMTFVVGVVGVLYFETSFVIQELVLIIIAFGIYFFQLALGYWRYRMPSSLHTYLAKLSAIVQAIFIVWVIFFGVEYWFFYLMIALSILETIEEIILIIVLPEWKSNVRGLYWVLKQKKT